MTIGIRFVSRFRFKLVADGEAVEVGQHQVEQDQVGRVLADGGLDLRTREELDRLEVAGLHQAGQDIVGVALIVDDQNGARHGQSSKGLRKIDRFLSCTTMEDVVFSIVTRRAQAWQGFETVDHRLSTDRPTPANQHWRAHRSLARGSAPKPQ